MLQAVRRPANVWAKISHQRFEQYVLTRLKPEYTKNRQCDVPFERTAVAQAKSKAEVILRFVTYIINAENERKEKRLSVYLTHTSDSEQ